MPFCYSPWTNIDISPSGDFAPCAKYQFGPDEERFNIRTNSVRDYSCSQSLQTIKQSFNNNVWPEGCQRCRLEEQNNIRSKRQLDLDRWQHHYSVYDLTQDNFITASVAFGNTCNLTCITCNPGSSSKWQKEYAVIYNKSVEPFHFYKQDFVVDFIQQSPNIVHLDIPGGEPFLSGVTEQKKLLQHYIESGQASNLSIHYTTNCTVMPDQEWWQLWTHFKEVEIQLSIDGIGPRFEYIRYPGNWQQAIKNIDTYISQQDKIKLSVSHTVSAYNIYYLDEFFSWCHSQKLPRPWLGRVHNPAHMRLSVWPEPAKKFIIDHLKSSTWQDVQTWADLMNNTNDSDLFDTFKQRCHQHDQYRNTNFASVFPELAPYI